MLRLATVFCLLLLPTFTFGQTAQIDSLLTAFDKSQSQREKTDILIELSTAVYDHDVIKGREYAERALSQARQQNYGGGIRAALTLVGFYYCDVGDFRKALDHYFEAARVAAPDDHRAGYNYIMIANVYRSTAKYDSSEIFYQKGIALLRKLNDDSTLAYAYRNAGRLYLRQWNNDAAALAFEKAKEIYDRTGSKFGQANVLFAMAELNINRSNFALAEDYVSKGCDIAEQLGDDYMRMHCHIFRGEIEFRLGEFLGSLENLLKALDLLKQRDNPQTLARVYGDLGDVYETLGQNDVALRYYFEATKIGERLGLKYEVAEIQSDIAWIYKNLRNFNAAFNFIDKSLKLREEIGDQYGISNCHNVKGIIYLQQKKFPEAIAWLEKSLRMREAIQHTEGVAACLFNLGLVYEEQLLYHKALEYHFAALKLEEQIGNKYNIGTGYNSVGNVLTYLEKYDSAVVYLQQAEKIGSETGSMGLKLDNSDFWSQYFEKQGNHKEALRWHKKYAQLKDSVYHETSATKLAEMQALYQTDQKDKEIQLLSQERELQSNQIQLQDARINQQSFLIVFIVVAFILVSLLAYKSYRYNREIQTAHGEIVKQKEEIQVQSSEIQKAYDLIADSHKELEAKVEERTSALREAYKELDTFFYRASHDFRRPLTTFLGLVEVANITVKDPSAVELFHKVQETALYLDKMLFKLQSISDLGSQQLDYEEVMVPSIFNDVLESFRHQIEEKNIRIYTSCVLPQPFYSYPAMIQVIVENLIENAIAFCRYEKAFIKLRAFESEGNVVIEVEDNGDGIDQQFHGRIFEMYFRGNERSKGNGLGLYIVKKGIDKLRAKLEFKSARDKGTLFRLTFPMRSEPMQVNA
jgi:signal transduction histidine kinase